MVKHLLLLLASLCVLPLAATVMAAELVAPAISEMTRPDVPATGLCAHVGTTDGALEAGLAATGRWVVHGLTTDEQVAKAATAKLASGGQIGTVSLARVESFGHLPYPNNFVTLLIADLDGLATAAPPAVEIDRVLAPYGVAYLRKAGGWTIKKKALIAGMDTWTHFYHGPDGNPASLDQLVKPGSGVQWIAGRETDMASGTNLYRLDEGRALYETVYDRKPMLMCRNAFNGVLLWSVPLDARPWKSRSLVMQEGMVYTHLGNQGQSLVALDAATGKVVRTYDQAAVDKGDSSGKSPSPNVVFHKGVLYQTSPGAISAIDAKTGALLWRKDETGKIADLPTVAPDLNRLFYTAGPVGRHGGRFVWHKYNEVVGLDLATGKQEWRSSVGERWTAGLVYSRKRLFLIEHINALEQAKPRHRLALSAVDGKELWSELFKSDGTNRVYTEIAVSGDNLYLTGPGAYELDPATGKTRRKWGEWGNARCDSSRMTPNYLLLSFGNFVDLKTGLIRRFDLTRGTCGGGTTPGYGMTYYLPDRCRCFDAISGAMALTEHVPQPPMPENRRLTSGPGRAATTPASETDWPVLLANGLHAGANSSTLAATLNSDWSAQVQSPLPLDKSPLLRDIALGSDVHRPITAPTVAANRLYVAVPDAHRIDCLDAASGKRLWSFTAGGRIDGPPTLSDGYCLFGCHDGRVYALDAASGAVIWSYLAAPEERYIFDHGQMASAWPVHASLVVASGKVWAVAGRHPDADGGMVMCALDVKTGKSVFRHNVVRPRAWMPADSKQIDKADPTARYNGGFQSNRTRNSALYTDGKAVQLDMLAFDAVTGKVGVAVAKFNWSIPQVLAQAHEQLGLVNWESREDYSGPGSDRFWTFQITEHILPEQRGRPVGLGNQVISRADRNAYRGDQLVEVARGKVRAWSLKGWDTSVDGDTNSPKRKPVWASPALAGKVLALILTKSEAVVAYVNAQNKTTEIQRYSLSDGKPLASIQVNAIMIENTLAATEGHLYASFEDGTIRAWK